MLVNTNGPLRVKAGLNRWESIFELDMAPADQLRAGGAQGDWWRVELDLPQELFAVDFIVIDSASGGVDNNRAKVGWLCIKGEA